MLSTCRNRHLVSEAIKYPQDFANKAFTLVHLHQFNRPECQFSSAPGNNEKYNGQKPNPTTLSRDISED